MELPNAVPWGCNVCGKHRSSDVNHWWVLYVTDAGNMVLLPYSDETAKIPTAAHACGQAHAQILVARFMAHGSFEKLPQEVDNEPGT